MGSSVVQVIASRSAARRIEFGTHLFMSTNQYMPVRCSPDFKDSIISYRCIVLSVVMYRSNRQYLVLPLVLLAAEALGCLGSWCVGYTIGNVACKQSSTREGQSVK